uniref:Uncharacterized protein n=1 Tax=Hemiselmis tepida TaxID=464990 RepID=A0A7S0YU95_9CRYP|mmetsp:Transcript_21733/g.54863  ORF Transcript_21733/g.54863 Transcript_21733/m.54863 type:complete len:247 (+) Transcript_21733:24-764(+)
MVQERRPAQESLRQGDDSAIPSHPQRPGRGVAGAGDASCAIYIESCTPAAAAPHPPPNRPSHLPRPHDGGACAAHQGDTTAKPPTSAVHGRRKVRSSASSDEEVDDERACSEGISRLNIHPIGTSLTTGRTRGAPRQRKGMASVFSPREGRGGGVGPTLGVGLADSVPRRGNPDTAASSDSSGGGWEGLSPPQAYLSWGWWIEDPSEGYNPNDGSDFAFLSLPMELPVLPGPSWGSDKPPALPTPA